MKKKTKSKVSRSTGAKGRAKKNGIESFLKRLATDNSVQRALVKDTRGTLEKFGVSDGEYHALRHGASTLAGLVLPPIRPFSPWPPDPSDEIEVDKLSPQPLQSGRAVSVKITGQNFPSDVSFGISDDAGAVYFGTVVRATSTSIEGTIEVDSTGQDLVLNVGNHTSAGTLTDIEVV